MGVPYCVCLDGMFCCCVILGVFYGVCFWCVLSGVSYCVSYWVCIMGVSLVCMSVNLYFLCLSVNSYLFEVSMLFESV